MKKRKLKRIILISANIAVVIGLAVTSVFYYVKYNDAKLAGESPQQKLARYEKEISKTYTLPTDEKANFIPVENAEVYKRDETNKEFFKDIENGDALLIYTNNKLGIIYRPSTKKIIKTGPIAFKQQYSIAIVGNKADRDAVIDVMKRAFSNETITANELEPKTPVTGQTVVVDLSGNNKEFAEKVALELKGVTGNVPEGQDRPADGFTLAIYAARVQ